ncbi:hypothetical protein [Escherichia albertii]|uniref:hypothetical protein n=1 Tax=Escherichia albertii TaxID=208962 RepID=UPI001775C2C3|nr:hypothetical protein [Escherichia albertii]
MAKKINLAKRKAQWARQFKPQIIRGAPLNYNAAQAGRIEAELLKLVRRMTRETQQEITALFQSGTGKHYFATDASVSSQSRILLNSLASKFMKVFKSRAKGITEKMLKGAANSSTTSLRQSIEQLTGGRDTFNGYFFWNSERKAERGGNTEHQSDCLNSSAISGYCKKRGYVVNQ